MSFDVELPNGVVLKDIPDGTSKEAIMQKAISSGAITADEFGVAERKSTEADRIARIGEKTAYELRMEQDSSSIDAFQAGIGRGFAKTGRGIATLWNKGQELFGMDETEDLERLKAQKDVEKQAFAPLEEKNPYALGAGELVGEIAATAPLGMGVGSGVGALTKGGSRLASVLPAASAGFTEGAIIGADEGQALAGGGIGFTAGATAELVFPKIGKFVRKVFGKVIPPESLVKQAADGTLTPTLTFQKALDDVGVTFDDVLKQGDDIAAMTPEALAAKSAFAKEGITPASQTRLMKDVKTIQKEGYLLRQTDSTAADEFRKKVVAENEAIKNRFQSLADDLGVTGEEGGEKLKNALFDVKSTMRSRRNQAYRDLADVAKSNPELTDKIPMNTDYLTDALFSVRDLGLDDSTEKAIVRNLNRYGFGEADNVASPLSSMLGDTQPQKLTIGTLSDFRKTIGETFDMSKPKEAKARNALMSAIDDMEAEIVDAFDGSGIDMPEQIAAMAKAARGSVIAEKKALETGDLITKLLKPIRSGQDAKEAPLVAASEVYNKLQSKNTSVEDVRKLANILINSESETSLEALGNMQASIVMDLLDSATKAKGSRLVNPATGDSVQVFSGSALNKRIKSIGMPKLKAIFKNNPEALKSIERLAKIGERMITPAEAMQQGSLPPDVLNKLMGSVAKMKNVNLIGVAGDVAEGLQVRRALSGVNKYSPEIDSLIDYAVFENSPNLQALFNVMGYGATQAPAVSASGALTERE